MATATSRRISTGIAWSTFGVLAWATLSILTSGGAAHAEEEPDGLLGNVTSIVAPLVTEVVTPVVADVVAPILQTPVVQVASESVPVVTDLLQHAPVSSITTPILDAATAVPVIGDVLSGLGVPGAVDDVAAVVDTTDSGVSPQSDIPTGIVSAPITAVASAETSAPAATATMLTGRLFDDSGATLATVDDSADASDVPSLPAKARMLRRVRRHLLPPPDTAQAPLVTVHASLTPPSTRFITGSELSAHRMTICRRLRSPKPTPLLTDRGSVIPRG
ncbi:hypothetical protein [Microbacterium sp. CH12i]|uniref:hypothetical protein n=1 Tax=Microbacterium sp. CH12i TaxID=1479651 RepID=UPI000A3EDB27|nr:hypothetical protein [Microbacterium sp. CH12i]